jgi:hypothetical protein
MPRPREFAGFGGYGGWPDTDLPFEEQDPSPYYVDGYANRMPGGGHYESPTDLWADKIVYPEREYCASEAQEERLYLSSRAFRITVGNVTGRRPGPPD